MSNIKGTVFLIILIFSIYKPVLAQEKVSATFEAIEGKVIIYYTIKGEAEKEYKIDIVLKRTSVPSFELVPEEMSGDIGTGKFAGTQRTIIWHITPEEQEKLDGDDFYFEVTAAEVKEGGGFPWLYVAGGAALAGGAAAYFILKKDETGGETTNFPMPPGRP
jgi:hypothetical protein